jgi:3-methyladenine DNA glycosylase/8-oxoguanine DNA glycosylase
VWHNPDRFGALVHSIIAQQISTRAARAIHGRLEAALPRTGITPRAILRLSDEALRAVGLSAGKVRSLRVPVRGIGRWTAQMFLIFSLGRLDVLPVDDYGLRAGIRNQYGLEELPGRKEIEETAEPWRPYRSIGTWYLWRSLGGVPQSE